MGKMKGKILLTEDIINEIKNIDDLKFEAIKESAKESAKQVADFVKKCDKLREDSQLEKT